MRRLFFLLLILPALLAADKPEFISGLVTTATPGHAVEIKADITGAEHLYLVVTDGGDGFRCDWADWLDPTLHGPDGRTKTLTELGWESATTQFGKVHVDKNVKGRPMRVMGKKKAYGIGTHANSIIAYDLPPGFTEFTARGALDDSGAIQFNGKYSSIRFTVYTEKPENPFRHEGGGLPPFEELARLNHPDDLEVSLFAAEPLLVNPTSIDIDAQGRVWVYEVVNYRHFRNTDKPLREAGDRILILEDTDHDGRADKSTTFYQSRDLDGGHGVCVLGNRVIVTTPDEVFILTDTDGDDHADEKELLFSCTAGVNHDHGIHAFKFGPDGKLYFNFGNAALELNDSEGNLVIDLAGNKVEDGGDPYRQGMVFRCDIDGSNVETLAWNFRNPWELAVDSFGNIWQSDNDDDGNRSTRINFVMEFGNYGYVDELTGASWRSQGWSSTHPLYYWHWSLGDPGVVPNLLNTGAGAPTGIVFYEGKQLPQRYQNAIIHADALPHVVRAYPVEPEGAGFTARIENIIVGVRDKWFRPSDVCVAPDGSLFVADWYDAGVGGHRMVDIQQGRIFRVTTPENAESYNVPELDFKTPAGAGQALTNPALSVRYLAWTALVEMGEEAVPALKKLWHHKNPYFRARALWVLGQGEDGPAWVKKAIGDENPNIRITGIRLARQLAHDGKLELPPVLEQVVRDENPQVRRTCAIALREVATAQARPLWLELAAQYDGHDRWYLEALGIAADGRWEEFFPAWLARVGEEWNTPAGRDIIWRSRSSKTPVYLAKIIRGMDSREDDPSRYFRAFDFQPVQPAQQVLIALAANPSKQVNRSGHLALQALRRVKSLNLDNPLHKKTLDRALKQYADNCGIYVLLVDKFDVPNQNQEIIELAIQYNNDPKAVHAIRYLFEHHLAEFVARTLASLPADKASLLAQALGFSYDPDAIDILFDIVRDDEADLELRRQSVASLARSRNGAKRLLKLIEQDKLDSALEQAAEAALLSNADPALQARIDNVYPPSKENPLPPILELVKRRGDANKGRLVFLGDGTCVKCHQFMGVGKNVGPDLSGIGQKLSRQALYESILYPSAGISHNYQSYVAVTQEGTVVTGLLISKTPKTVVLKGGDGIEHSFKRDELVELVKQEVSLMPDDLHRVLSEEQIVDLVAFLVTLKEW